MPGIEGRETTKYWDVNRFFVVDRPILRQKPRMTSKQLVEADDTE